MRPIMTREELASFEVKSYGRDYAESDDGWSDMEAEGKRGWSAVSGWSRDGWDLGDWPYVVISVRDVPRKILCSECGTLRSADSRPFKMMQTVEGDRSVYAFATPEDRDAAIDYLFIWYGVTHELDEWAVEGLTYDKREALDAGTLRVPERFRGPFSWARLNAETTLDA